MANMTHQWSIKTAPLLLLLSISCGSPSPSSSNTFSATEFPDQTVDLPSFVTNSLEIFAGVRNEIDLRAGNGNFAHIENGIRKLPGLFDEGSPYKNLAIEELAALRVYSSWDSRKMNTALWTKDKATLGLWKNIILAAASGCNKLDNFLGSVVRGVELPESVIAQYTASATNGTLKAELGFTSTSRTDEVSSEFRSNTEFRIQSTGGCPIDKIVFWPAEKEVLFVAGSEFNVHSVQEEHRVYSDGTQKTVTVIRMTEVLKR